MSKGQNCGEYINDSTKVELTQVEGDYKVTLTPDRNYGIINVDISDDDANFEEKSLSHTESNFGGRLNSNPYRDLYSLVTTDPFHLGMQEQIKYLRANTESVKYVVTYHFNKPDDFTWFPNYVDMAIDPNDPSIFRDVCHESIEKRDGYVEVNPPSTTEFYTFFDNIAQEYQNTGWGYGTGEHFAHWNTEPDGSGISINENESIVGTILSNGGTISKDFDLYAIWEEDPFFMAKVHYDEIEIPQGNIDVQQEI